MMLLDTAEFMHELLTDLQPITARQTAAMFADWFQPDQFGRSQFDRRVDNMLHLDDEQREAQRALGHAILTNVLRLHMRTERIPSVEEIQSGRVPL
jgi:hypothetical protein